MYIKVNKWGFISAICNDKYNSMPAQAAGHLFEYLEDYEKMFDTKDTHNQRFSQELDVVAIRLTWDFFECAEDFVEQYGEDYGTTYAEIAENHPFSFIPCDGVSFISEVL
tara:strand:- start:155 stop:484 length:330 start_codon:yes stop_codon:yes gene_type:complete